MVFKKNDPRINRNGRPKGSGLCLTTLLKEMLEEVPEGEKDSYKRLFIKSLIHKALVEKDTASYRLIMNYVDGLPKQDIKLDVDLKQVMGFNFVKPEKPKKDDTNNTDNKTDH